MRIFTIGETTFDILFRDGQPVGAFSGGSAYNSAVSLGRCGLPVWLISTFGNDHTGDLSMAFLMKNGVNCNLIKRFTGQSRIALAFLDSGNNADYSFYQASKDIFPDYPVPMKDDIILLGSSFALKDTGREQLIRFLQKAKKGGCIIIYDPNTRQPLAGKPEIRNKIMENIALATIIKGSDHDFMNIFGLDDGKSVYSLISEFTDPHLIYTKGADGAELFNSDFKMSVKADKTKVVSTIGAGDNFSAGIIWGLFIYMNENHQFGELVQSDWGVIMKSGSLFASAVCGSYENYIPEEFGRKQQSRFIIR
jgi:fructokinase